MGVVVRWKVGVFLMMMDMVYMVVLVDVDWHMLDNFIRNWHLHWDLDGDFDWIGDMFLNGVWDVFLYGDWVGFGYFHWVWLVDGDLDFMGDFLLDNVRDWLLNWYMDWVRSVNWYFHWVWDVLFNMDGVLLLNNHVVWFWYRDWVWFVYVNLDWVGHMFDYFIWGWYLDVHWVGDLLLNSDWVWLGHMDGVWFVYWNFHVDRVGNFLLNGHWVWHWNFLVDGDFLDMFMMVVTIVLTSTITFVIETSLLVLGFAARDSGYNHQSDCYVT
jgi:hypothetical protein